MRRWLVIFLLALLPLQFSWAVVVGYCEHETGEKSQHFGHHEHHPIDDASAQHADAEGAEGTDSVEGANGLEGSDSAKCRVGAPADHGTPASLHADCGHCHGTCASIPASLATLTPVSLPSYPVSPGEGVLRSLVQSPPERPQWAPLA